MLNLKCYPTMYPPKLPQSQSIHYSVASKGGLAKPLSPLIIIAASSLSTLFTSPYRG